MALLPRITNRHGALPILALAASLALAQTAPSMPAAVGTPTIFAPGVISGPANDSDPCFTADGGAVIFARNSTLMIARRAGEGWSKPDIAPFSGRWSDQQPTLSPDGTFLVFVSNRPTSATDKTLPAGNLWRVDRVGSGWGEPTHLSTAVNLNRSIWAPSIASDGSLYFIKREDEKAPFRLWRSQFRNGAYEQATPISFGDATTQDVDPAVAPDESFIVFGSMHPGPDAHERLCIAFREGDHWGKPIDLGPAVNGPNDTNEARLSVDGRTLYFSSDRTLPVRYPRTPAQAQADLARMEAWDNGNLNIWSVSLAPWLEARRKTSPSKGV